MEFNPLDLLACAAEIQQQRHDDNPDPAIMTRQRRANSLTSKRISNNSVHKESKLNAHKENKDIMNNNVKNTGITVVRKLKIVNSDLEKMLDEHNYGNAKKGFKYDADEALQNRERTDSVSERLPVLNESTEIASPQALSICGGDLSSEITSRLRDHESDVENSSDNLRQNVSSIGDLLNIEDSRRCINAESSTSRTTSQTDTLALVQVDCVTCDNTGHSVNTHPLIDNPCKQINSPERDISTEHTCLGQEPQNMILKCSQSQKFTSNGKSRESRISISKEHIVADDTQNSEQSKAGVTLCLDEKQGQARAVSVPMSPDATAEQPQTVIINISKQRSNIASTILFPPSEQSSCMEKSLQQPSRDNSDNIKSTKPDLPIITSLLTTGSTALNNSPTISAITEKTVSQECNNSVMSQSVRDQCDSFDFSNSSVSCELLKRSLELSASICTDRSVGSVHLLSPDRRNPDSMGVSESPITEVFSPSGDDFMEGEITEIETSNCDKKLNSALYVKTDVESGQSSCDESTLLSDNKAQLVTPSTGEATALSTSDTVSVTRQEPDMVASPCDIESRHIDSAHNIDKDAPIFRFVSDHCYAGVPGKAISQEPVDDPEADLLGEEINTPSVCSTGELSQDSGYGDITQSPGQDIPAPSQVIPAMEPQTTKNLIPVLISVNENGSVTIHNDASIASNLTGQLVAFPEGINSIDTTKVLSAANVLNGSNSQVPDKQAENKIVTSPFILSPVGKSNSPILTDSRLVFKNDSIIGVLRPTTPDMGRNNLNLNAKSPHTHISPPKFGKFKIGTFASFSNTEMCLEGTSPKLNMSPQPKTTRSLKSSSPEFILGSELTELKNKIKGGMKYEPPEPNIEFVQHDHDYCMKNLTPLVVNTAMESRPARDISKGKVTHNKGKKSESDAHKGEGKSQKRIKKSLPNVVKEDSVDDFELEETMMLEDDVDGQDVIRPKTRAEKYIEQKSVEPKVKITGSSVFQDQFVYFMNTKKRSRRRESHEVPYFGPRDRIWVPPKPGDIIVPHLSDAELEKIKERGKGSKFSGQNSLRVDILKSYNQQQTSQPPQSDSSFDEESKIINTILSLENEDDMAPEPSVPSFSEAIGMFNPTNDILNFSPEQMNLTQEQIELLFSAVDEVQNSSPGLVGSEKLVSPAPGDPTFGQFPPVAPTAFESSGVTPTLEQPATKSAMAADDSQTCTSQTVPPADTDVSSPAVTAATDSAVVEPEPRAMTPNVAITSPIPTSEDSPADLPPLVEPSSPNVAGDSLETKSDTKEMEIDTNDAMQTETVFGFNPRVLKSNQPEAKCRNLPNDIKSPFVGATDAERTSSPVKTLLQSATPASANISTSINPDLQLPSLDRSSLDMLVSDGNDFRLDKTEFFPETSETPRTDASTVPNTPMTMPLDYTAPWIVMVSMYWNDLPAIMISNLPFVRLVDIHKQILPAKDTGILKKRCQLMGVCVMNCSEMQRYFLVQYGKAFNSKSTLIVSKDDAKILIGYYVDPQPKAKPHEDRKSIIEHRRLQLRRIALARRAAIRAEKEKSEVKSQLVENPGLVPGKEPNTDTSRLPEPMLVEASPVPTIPRRTSTPILHTQASRSTRHKKINFLKMLHGDSPGHSPEESGDNEKAKKPQRRSSVEPNISAKRRRAIQKPCKKKPVKYVVSSDSSSEDLDDSSESSSYSDSSESSCESGLNDIPVLKPRNMVNSSSRGKDKAKLPKSVPVKASAQVPPLKVKARGGFPAPKAKVKVVSTAAAVPPVVKNVEKRPSSSETHRAGGHCRSMSPPNRGHSPTVILGRVLNPPVGDETSIVVPSVNCDSIPTREHTRENKHNDIDDHSVHHTPGTGVVCNKHLSVTETRDSGNVEGPSVVADSEMERCKLETSDNNEKDIKCSGELERSLTPHDLKCDSANNTEVVVNRRCSTPLNVVGETQMSYGDDAIIISDESDMSHEDLTQSLETETAHDSIEVVCEQNDESDVKHSVSVPEIVSLEAQSEHITCEKHAETSETTAQVDKLPESPINSYCANVPGMSESGCVFVSDRSPSMSSDSRSQSPLVTEFGDRGVVSGRRKEFVHIGLDEVSLSVVHRDASPHINGHRNRSQLGEVFVDRYGNKKSLCMRCYTCRKMMSVDNFLRHLHDVVSGGMVAVDTPRTIAVTECDLTESERKLWESFQRKKELFDNNQLPSPGVTDERIVYNVDSDSNHSMPEKVLGTLKPVERERGPIVIQTPVSRGTHVRKGLNRHSSGNRSKSGATKPSGIPVEKVHRVIRAQSVFESAGVRTSSRKRKLKKLYPDEDYSYMKKLPRLSSEMVEGDEQQTE